MSPPDAAIIFDNVSVTLGNVKVLESVSAAVPRHSTTAVVGPNGAGKTTLVLAILGQVAHSGRITLEDASPGKRPRIGYVPQRLDFDRGTPVTVLETLVMGRQQRPLWFGATRAHRDKALEALVSVRAEHLAYRRLGVLSGGELQRVLLAVAVQEEPDILLLDEPASGIDAAGEDVLCELLDELHERFGFTQLMVNHDLPTVLAHASYVICLNRRLIAAGPTRETLTDDVLEATFGIHLGLVDITSCRLPQHGEPGHRHGGPGHA